MSAAPNMLRWIGLVGIASIAMMRAVTAFAPEVYFDVDPADHFAPLAALSPAGSLVLDVLLLLACATALLGELFSGRALELKLLVVALLPAPLILWHGWHDLGDLWRGVTWLAAAVALVSVAHLARDHAMRLVLLSVLIASIGPLLVRGLAQVTVEYSATVAEFERSKEYFFEHRGWEPDSPAARIYERRLRQRQPTGWFTTTNIYGSVIAAGLMVMLGMGIGLVRSRQAREARGWFIALAAIIVASGVALLLTGSRGAIFAGIGGGLLLTVFASRRASPHLRTYAPFVLLAFVAIALAGVFVRGALLPEDFLGDRSLLFRWHYLASAWEILRHAPLLGTGPDGYQLAYTQFRMPRNPEEVVSAHSVFVDWVCTLGILGAAWIALTLMMMWRTGQKIATGNASHSGYSWSFDPTGLTRNVAAAVAVLGAVPAILVEFHVLDEFHMFLRVMGIAAFLGIAALVTRCSQRIDPQIGNCAVAVAAAVLLMHGQIEMTFFQSGSVVWAMCLLGVAGGAVRSDHSSGGRALPMTLVGLVIGVGAWIGIAGARPALIQQSQIAEAAAVLHPPAELRGDRHRQRKEAAALLVEAHHILPTNPSPLHNAIRQLERVAADLHADERVAMLDRTVALADKAVALHRHSISLSERAAINVQLGIATADARYYEVAIADLRRLTELDPHGIQPWRGLGDLLWILESHEQAAAAYERALENDANFVLDPLKRLSEVEREAIRQRVEAVGKQGRGIG